jgi:hypothetical protein
MDSIKIYSRKKRWYFWVMPEFLSICPNPEKCSAFQLLIDYDIRRYLHNEEGLASNWEWAHGLIDMYYLNGKQVSKLEVKRARFNKNFHNKLEKLVSD